VTLRKLAKVLFIQTHSFAVVTNPLPLLGWLCL